MYVGLFGFSAVVFHVSRVVPEKGPLNGCVCVVWLCFFSDILLIYSAV